MPPQQSGYSCVLWLLHQDRRCLATVTATGPGGRCTVATAAGCGGCAVASTRPRRRSTVARSPAFIFFFGFRLRLAVPATLSRGSAVATGPGLSLIGAADLALEGHEAEHSGYQ